MDEVLSRKLFLNKAKHYEQIKSGNVGKYVTGVFMGAGARALPYLSRGLQFLERPVPATIGTVLAGKTGFDQALEGYRNEDPAQTSQGIVNLLAASRFGVRGLKNVGNPRAAKLDESLGKTKFGRITDPYKLKGALFYTGTGLGLDALSSPAQSATPVSTQQIQPTQQTALTKSQIINDMKKTVDVQGGALNQEQLEQARQILIRGANVEPKEAQQIIFDFAREQPKTVTGYNPQTGVAIRSDVPETKPEFGGGFEAGQFPVRTEITPQVNVDLKKDITPDQRIEIAKDRQNKEQAGATIRENVNKEDKKTKSEFEAAYNQLMNLTGGDQKSNDLLLYKLAAGLLTGKTTSPGVRGFLDVFGQSALGVADSAIKLHLQEQENRKDFAVEFLKQKNKKEDPTGGVLAGSESFLIPSNAPNAIEGLQSITLYRADGTVYPKGTPMVLYGGQYYPVSVNQDQLIKVSDDAASRRKLLLKLDASAAGLAIVNEVLQFPETIFNASGRINLMTKRFIGTLNQTSLALKGLNLESPNIDSEIIQKITEEANPLKASELINTYKQRTQNILGRIKTDSEEEQNLAKAEIYSLRLGYLMANASKAEDRLTQKDVDAFLARTDILRFINKPSLTQSTYKVFKQQLESQFMSDLKNARNFGLVDSVIEQKYADNPNLYNLIYKQSKQQNKTNQPQTRSQTQTKSKGLSDKQKESLNSITF